MGADTRNIYDMYIGYVNSVSHVSNFTRIH